MSRMLDSRFWVLVADGERARVMLADASAEGRFRTVLPLGTVEGPHCPPPLRDQMPEIARSAFVADLARRMNDEARAHAFDRFVVVAPARVLHDLRQALDPEARSRLAGSIECQCAQLDDAALSRILVQWWQAPAEAA